MKKIKFLNQSQNIIRIAIQKKGRLRAASLNYLKKCGLKFQAKEKDLIVECKNSKINLIFVRNNDIPEYLKQEAADFGIVGENTLWEKEQDTQIIKKLGFGKCSLVLATTKRSKIKSIKDLSFERIATSYPNTLRKVLSDKKISASIIKIKGSVEICPKLGIAEAIFDIVQTGKTLEANNLKILEKIAESEAVLIKNSNKPLKYEELFL